MGGFLARLVHLRQFARDARDLVKLLLDRLRGRYRGPVLRSTLALVLGIAYVAIPTDLIPDAILALGVVDDYVVVAALLELAKREIDAYRSRMTEVANGPKPKV